MVGWKALWLRLQAADPDFLAGVPPVDDREARESMCATDAPGSSCDGAPPWIVKVRGHRGTWAYHVVAVDESSALVASDAFGRGELARCAASTTASLVRERGRLRVVVEDYFEFPDEECGDCDPERDECDCTSGCGEPIAAHCTFDVEPESLAFGKPDAACDAHELGVAAGLDD